MMVYRKQKRPCVISVSKRKRSFTLRARQSTPNDQRRKQGTQDTQQCYSSVNDRSHQQRHPPCCTRRLGLRRRPVVTAGTATATAVGCVPTWPVPTAWPVPTIPIVELLGTPFTTTNSSAGPGVSRFAFGGTCETYRTYDPSSLTLYVLLSCTCR